MSKLLGRSPSQSEQSQPEHLFPWYDIDVDRNSRWLQVKHSLEGAKSEYLSAALPCPKCKASADRLSWLYFRSPRGFLPPLIRLRRGWLTVCDRCHLQVDFFVEEQEYYSWNEVNACRNDPSLQSQHPVEDAKKNHLHNAAQCPRCGADPSQISWVHFRQEGYWPKSAGWLTICDQCNIQIDFFVEEQQHYPWEQVNASMNDVDLQSRSSVEEAKSQYLARAAPCPKCKTPADGLSWFYFQSSPESWDALAGRAGWMTICDECAIQVDFFLGVMS